MRGVAAIGVACMHFHSWIADWFFASGYLAVDIFFVLSGFVISCTFDERLRSGLKVSDFAAARLIRFWPVLLLGVALGAVKILALIPAGKADYSALSAVVAIFFNAILIPFQLGANQHAFRINAPSWTLFFELWINIIYAAALRFLSVAVLTLICVGSFIGLIFVAWHGSQIAEGGDFGSLHIGLLRTAFSFSIGAIIQRTRTQWWHKVPDVGPLPVLALTAVGLAAIPSAHFRLLYDLAFIGIASPALIIFGARVQLAPNLASVAAWLGAVSYPLYALNIPVRDLVPLAVFRAGVPSAPLAFLILAVLIGTSALIERWYDIPARAWLRQRYRASRSALAV